MRQYVKGRVYGETIDEEVPTFNGMYRIISENRFNRKDIYENHINDLINEIKTGVHPVSFVENGEIIKSFILEDVNGVKYEIVESNDESAMIEELDSDGIGSGSFRKYAIDVLAKLIYAHHFAFNVSNARNAIKYGSELHEYELAKYWC